MNKPLTMIHFFPALEGLVTRLTGLLPRQDDIGAEAAQAVFEATASTEPPVVQAAKELLAATEDAERVPSARSS
jgi:ubiquitin-conjugating enzyme E2 variant